MWFGTGEGLNKYDGASFTVFKVDPAQPNRSLQNGFIMGLCEGDANRIWAITNGGGLHEVNRKTGQVTPHLIRGAQATRWNSQISVYLDQQHILWITTMAGLARFDPVRRRFTLYPSPVADVAVKSVYEDRQHRFWVATHQGLFLFDRATGRFSLVPVQGIKGAQPSLQSFYLDQNDVLWMGSATEGFSLLKLNLRDKPWKLVPYNPGGKLNPYIWRNTLHRDSTGIVWVGTTDGLQGIDPATDQVFTYRSDPNRYKGLSSSSIQAAYHDRSGMFWIGTEYGIDRQSGNSKPFMTYQAKPNERRASVPENRAYSVFKDSRGQIWFNNSPDLYRLSADQSRLENVQPHILPVNGPYSRDITSFLADGSNGIWFGSLYGLYHYDLITNRFTAYPSKISAQFISGRTEGNKLTGDIWVGGDNGFASFNRKTHQFTYHSIQPENPNSIPDKDVYSILVSKSGDVWLVIHRLGLCKLNPKTGQITRYTAGGAGQLSSNDIHTIYEDPSGIIWIGTHRGGLNRLDPKTGRFSAITHQNGIPGTTIFCIISDESGDLWLGTNDGLCRFNPSARTIHTYKVSDGLPSNEFKQNDVFRHGNQLIFGTDNGIVQFNPAQIKDDTLPFPVHITKLTVMDQERALTDTIVYLKHNENLLTIGFAALAYEHPEQNQYTYKLDGLNDDWVENGNRTIVNFNSLSPGTYTFRVRAANSNGFWTTDEASLQLIVLPPWWSSWIAYVGYVLLAAGAIGGYIRYSTHRIRQRQELELNRRQAEQLKAVDELKTRFFSNITHEFRTPLSLIIAPVEKLLQEKQFDGAVLALVYRNAEKLLRLINQLLDLAKLEGQFMTIVNVRGQVREFIEQTIAVFQQAADHKRVKLTYTLNDFPSSEHVFDADKWEKIITNLVANALKFTEAGGSITLTTNPVWTDDEMTGVQFQLVDSGIGISKEKLPHIFDRFYQADTSTTRAHEGTGLGLALVNELIQLLGGTISVDSKVGAGTTFEWMLPVAQVLAVESLPLRPGYNKPAFQLETEISTKSTALPKTSGDGFAMPRILIVEDNEELRDFLVSELNASYTVFQAVDGLEGWEIAQAELPDIILTDVMMPRLDGNELCRLVKENSGTDHIAVVMLTAKTAQPSRMLGLQQGADEYLSKPFNMAELQLRIQNLVNRQQKLGEFYRQQFNLSDISDVRQEKPVSAVKTDPFLERIYALLEENLDDSSIGVDWLADKLAMNRKTLYRKIQSLIQLAPTDLIRQYRIRKGVELLLAGKSVAETADLTGFSTPSHFSMVFKEIYQQTPTEYLASRGKNG
nr:two-component regulator propeller domain-containing protein [Larkinella rosea]